MGNIKIFPLAWGRRNKRLLRILRYKWIEKADFWKRFIGKYVLFTRVGWKYSPISLVFQWEVCLWADEWEVIFSNRPGQQMTGSFFLQDGTANDRYFFHWSWLAKEKWVFQQPGRATKKGRWIALYINLGWQDKIFKLSDKRLIMNYLVNNKCKCANEMCLSVFMIRL